MKNPRSSVPQGQIRVLVVDDEIDLRELLAEEVESLTYQAVKACDGQDALDKLLAAQAKNPFNAILSDINMPKLNGLEMLKKIRALGLKTPLIFLTGYGDKEKALTALKLGATAFFEKPYERTKLLEALKSAVQQSTPEKIKLKAAA